MGSALLLVAVTYGGAITALLATQSMRGPADGGCLPVTRLPRNWGRRDNLMLTAWLIGRAGRNKILFNSVMASR